MKRLSIPAGCLSLLLLSGCLTVEMKEYRVRIKSNHSGEATIKFVNILSETDDSLDISRDDFNQLIEFYLEGTQLEKENPGFTNVKKRLYEQNGMLMGEISFTFDSLSAVRVFRFDKDSPFMYFVGNALSSEQLVETNGTRGPDWMPVVFWGQGEKELYVKARIVSEVSHRRSLLKNFLAWQSTHPDQKK